MLKTLRWLACDFPGCPVVYEPGHYAQWLASRARHHHRDIRDAATDSGWLTTEEGDDLCRQHAEKRQGQPPQPALFPVPEGDQPV